MGRLRLGYTKSRTGCIRCKQRRVKCDENRPCRACVRHGVECSLMSGSSQSSTRSETPPQHQPTSHFPHNTPLPDRGRPARPIRPTPWKPEDYIPSEHPSPSLGSTPDPFPYFAKFITDQPEHDGVNWVSDLELMHHFTTCTSKTLFLSKLGTSKLEVWQVEVPKMAFVHTFLLHQILAMAAFHLASLHPHQRQKYFVQATQHQSLAIEGARAALSNISSENCHALFAASSLFFLGALAASGPSAHSTHTPTVDDLVDVFLLVKGIGGVLDSSNAELRKGPFAQLFALVGSRKQTLTIERVTAQLNRFHRRVLQLPADDPTRAIIDGEISLFLLCIENAIETAATGPEYRVIASFPIVMTEKCISLLRQRNPVALAMLSYYCVVMHATEEGYWFTQGWSYVIMQDIARGVGTPWDEDSAWALGWITGHGREVLPSQ